MTDLTLKHSIYEQSGVASYWTFDPEQEALTVFELIDGRYVEWTVVTGDKLFEAKVPFPVQIVPAELVRRVNRSAG